MPRRVAGFTLIELLIVVAIIAILAAIATPNFLEAQTRSKIARVKADMRTVSVALESYHVDNNAYPPMFTYIQGFTNTIFLFLPYRLTTPIAYVSSTQALRDTFRQKWVNQQNFPGLADQQFRFHFNYINTRQIDAIPNIANFSPTPPITRAEFVGGWEIMSYGPDMAPGPYLPIGVNNTRVWIPYDPTNGTVSLGDIKRTQLDSTGVHKGAQ